MKTIGLLGGMSWQSTSDYYRYINAEVNSRLGKNHSAKILLNSFDFQPLHELQLNNDWEEISLRLASTAMDLELAGADCILILANTMHKVAPFLQTQINIPVIHIAEVTSKAIAPTRIKKIGLLGTKYTMSEDFLIKVYSQNNMEVLVPNYELQNQIHDNIINELCKGIITPEGLAIYLQAVLEMVNLGAQGIVLGCTEIPLIINQTIFDKAITNIDNTKLSSIQFFDTTHIHAMAAVDFALA